MDDAVATADEHFTSWHVAVADDVSIDIDDDDDDMTAAAAAAAASNAGNYLDYDTSTPHHTERYLLEHYEVKAQVGKGAFGGLDRFIGQLKSAPVMAQTIARIA